MNTPDQVYVLFKKSRVPIHQSRGFSMFEEMMRHHIGGESWKNKESDEKPEYKEVLVYVATVKTPKEVAAEVRKAPHDKHVLFVGEMHEIQIAMPVFIEGKSLDTLTSEWTEIPE